MYELPTYLHFLLLLTTSNLLILLDISSHKTPESFYNRNTKSSIFKGCIGQM